MATTTERNVWVLRAAWISLLVSIVLLAVKFIAYRVTGSVAVLSDALESIVNVVSALVAVLILRHVVEPADKEHPYGHGKLEYFSSAFEGGLIAFAALAIAFEAVTSWSQGHVPHSLDVGLVLVCVAAAVNLVVGLSLLSVGKKQKSEALSASGSHLLSDVITSAGVLVGLVLVYLTGITWLDPMVALLIAGHLARTGFRIVRRSFGALVDEMDPGVLNELGAALNKAWKSEIIDVHHLRLIRSGNFHHVDAHLVMPEFWSVMDSHRMATDYEMRVREIYPYDVEIAFHVDPCQQKYCRGCSYEECPIRKQAFEGRTPWNSAQLIKGPMDEEEHT